MDVDLSGLSGRIDGQKTPDPDLLGVAPKPCGSMNYLYGQVELMRAVGNTRAKARCCRVSPNTGKSGWSTAKKHRHLTSAQHPV